VSRGTQGPWPEPPPVAYRALTVYGPPSQAVQLTAAVDLYSVEVALQPGPTTPTQANLDRFGLFPGRSPLLRESRLILLPRGTEMFQFPRCPPAGLYIQPGVTRHEPRWVAPFGIGRLIARLQLPAHVSPLSASFLGHWPLGIPPAPLLAWRNSCQAIWRGLPHDRLRPWRTSSHFGKIEANTRCGCERAVEPVGLTTEEWVARRVSVCDRAIAFGGTSTRTPTGVTLRRLARPGSWSRAADREDRCGDGCP
jgi:hypothetical protein